jgi:hypothetical protein
MSEHVKKDGHEWLKKTNVEMLIRKGVKKRYLFVMIGEKKFLMQEVDKFWDDETSLEDVF